MRLFEQWKVKTIIKAECFLSCCRLFWSEKHKNYLLSKHFKWNSKMIAPKKMWMHEENFALTNFLPCRRVQKKIKKIDVWYEFYLINLFWDRLCFWWISTSWHRRPWISFILQNVETPKPVSQTTPNSSSLSWLKDIQGYLKVFRHLKCDICGWLVHGNKNCIK